MDKQKPPAARVVPWGEAPASMMPATEETSPQQREAVEMIEVVRDMIVNQEEYHPENIFNRYLDGVESKSELIENLRDILEELLLEQDGNPNPIPFELIAQTISMLDVYSTIVTNSAELGHEFEHNPLAMQLLLMLNKFA